MDAKSVPVGVALLRIVRDEANQALQSSQLQRLLPLRPCLIGAHPMRRRLRATSRWHGLSAAAAIQLGGLLAV